MIKKILLASFDPQNSIIKDKLQRIINHNRFEGLQIDILPQKGLSSIKVVNKLVKLIDAVEILVVYDAPITNKVIEAGKKLKLIVSARGGPVNIDIEAATKKKILVSNSPGHNAQAVADHAFGLLLSFVRNIVTGDRAVKDGRWFSLKEKLVFYSYELCNKTIGIVGFGNIGSLIAQRANGFGMKCLVYDPYVPEDIIQSKGGEKVPFDILLKKSDFITIHVRLNKQTYHMFSYEQFKMMKNSAILINVSRGSVIDEKALYEYLKKKIIAGACLDVFEEEPISADHPLCRCDNVILTPHIAYVGTDYKRGATMVAKEIKRYLLGQPIKYQVNYNAYVFERDRYDKIFKGRQIK